MKNILITGGMGFLGYSLALFFKQKGYNIFGIGHGHSLNFDHPFDIWKTNSITYTTLTDMKLEKIDYVFHCGGSGEVNLSFKYPNLDFQNTVKTTQQLCEYLRDHHPDAHLLYPSSVATIGQSDKKINEHDQQKPISPYGYHKYIAEIVCREYAEIFNIKTSIIRLFSIYGIGLKKQFLWDCVKKIQNNYDKDNIHFFGTGKEVRDFIHTTDVGFLFQKIMKLQKKQFEIYNGGSGHAKKIQDIAQNIATLLNYDGKITFSNSEHKGNPKQYLADTEKLIKQLNFQTHEDFYHKLKEYVEWAKKQ